MRFGYGAIVPWVTRLENGALRAIAGPDMMIVHTPVHLRGENMTTVGEFTINQGDTIPFVLSYSAVASAAARAARPDDGAQRDRDVLARLGGEVPAGGTVDGCGRALADHAQGAHLRADRRHGRGADDLAAGAARRRAQLGLSLLLAARRHPGPARRHERRLLRGGAGVARLAVARRRRQPGPVADHVRHRRRAAADRMGRRRGCPVTRIPRRCASAMPRTASFSSTSSARSWTCTIRRGAAACRATNRDGARSSKFLEHLSKIWREPDEGIWEVRGAPRHFTHSKVMAWVAFDRAIKSAETFGCEGRSINGARCATKSTTRSAPRASTRRLGSVRAVLRRRSSSTPACCCCRPVGFLPVSDPRVKGTVAAIERRLLRDGFVMRYDTENADDGLPPGEGAFLACSFWLVDVYIAAGPRRRTPSGCSSGSSALRNDVGLLSEEYDPRDRAAGRQLSAGLLARGAGQQRLQSHPRRKAGRAACSGRARAAGGGDRTVIGFGRRTRVYRPARMN